MNTNAPVAWIIVFCAVVLVLIFAVAVSLSQQRKHRRQNDRFSKLMQELEDNPSGGGFDNETPQTLRMVLERDLQRQTDRQSDLGGAGQYRGVGPKGYRRTDQKILEDISDLLTYASDVDASEIDVQVKDGIVTLEGFVDSRATLRRAEEIVESVPGVSDLKNQLKVAKPGSMPWTRTA
jgi:osmotically-inducible protein OsmY